MNVDEWWESIPQGPWYWDAPLSVYANPGLPESPPERWSYHRGRWTFSNVPVVTTVQPVNNLIVEGELRARANPVVRAVYAEPTYAPGPEPGVDALPIDVDLDRPARQR